ncbi:hypothetical protein phiOC_p099 [Ochrobactrum phage vB_OspM_OC]|nr:hypothetical protein phiOC_p099 [Ochrobactrum phage vB_OspM_OC]
MINIKFKSDLAYYLEGHSFEELAIINVMAYHSSFLSIIPSHAQDELMRKRIILFEDLFKGRFASSEFINKSIFEFATQYVPNVGGNLLRVAKDFNEIVYYKKENDFFIHYRVYAHSAELVVNDDGYKYKPFFEGIENDFMKKIVHFVKFNIEKPEFFSHGFE